MHENYIKIFPSDSSMLQFLKKRGSQCLKEKFVMSDIHLLGLFFHPKFKLLVLSPKERKNVHLHTCTLFSVASASSTVTNESESYAGPPNLRFTVLTATDHSYITPPKKSTKFSWLENEFQHWQDDFMQSQTNCEEVSSYIINSFKSTFVEISNIIKVEIL